MLEAIGVAEPLATYLDALGKILGRIRLQEYAGVNLWSHVRSGTLSVIAETDKGQQMPVYYASVVGVELIDPARRPFSRSLEMAKTALESINLPTAVENASDANRKAAVKLYSRGRKGMEETLQEMSQARLFVSVLNTATLRNWAAQENAPVRLYIRRDGLLLSIGRSESEAKPIHLNPLIDAAIPRMPD